MFAPWSVHYRAQPTTGAPVTATVPTEIKPSASGGMTFVFKKNQASERAAAAQTKGILVQDSSSVGV